MNPENGGVYAPQTSQTNPSISSAFEEIVVDNNSSEAVLQGVVKPLGKALNFTAAQRKAAVSTLQYFSESHAALHRFTPLYAALRVYA